MLTFTIRRLLLAIPTLIFIAFVIFYILDAAPGEGLADIPLTVPPEVRAPASCTCATTTTPGGPRSSASRP